MVNRPFKHKNEPFRHENEKRKNSVIKYFLSKGVEENKPSN